MFYEISLLSRLDICLNYLFPILECPSSVRNCNFKAYHLRISFDDVHNRSYDSFYQVWFRGFGLIGECDNDDRLSLRWSVPVGGDGRKSHVW